MKLLEHALRFPWVVSILAAMIGVGANRHSEFQNALRSRPAVRILAVLVAIRFRRLIGKLARFVAGKSSGSGENSNIYADGSVGKEQAIKPLSTGNTRSEDEILLLPRTAGEGPFPTLIFQTWKHKGALPEKFSRWSESLRQMNPDYDYILWDDVDNRRFIEKYYPWFLPIYDAYPKEIYRADAVRYFFLYQFGGLYADMDTECLRPVGPLFESGDVWLGRMGTDPDFPHSIPNAIMASRPLQEFWLLAIHLLVENVEALGDPATMAAKGPEAMTGPILLKNACDTYMSSKRSALRELIQEIAARLPADLQPQPTESRIDLLGPEYWYPIDWSNMLHLRLSCEVVDFNATLGERTKRWLFPKSFLVTYWTHSWKPTTGK